MPENDFTAVNRHCLNHLAALAARRRVLPQDDIVGADGAMLLERHKPMEAETLAQLAGRRLRQPLEPLLRLPDFDPPATLRRRGPELAAECRFLRALFPSAADRAACVALLEGLPLNGAVALWLAMLECQGGLDHALRTCLIAVGAARLLGLPRLQQQQVALAALLHDVGELYTDPNHLAAQHTLRLEEWRHVVGHPVLGCRLVGALAGLKQPRPVALAILQHHERLDGSGYPLGSNGAQLETPGQILMLADTVSQLLEGAPDPGGRIEIALKILPGEFDYALVSALCKISREAHEHGAAAPAAGIEVLPRLLRQIGRATPCFWGMKELESSLTPAGRAHLGSSMERFDTIQRALLSTGAGELTAEPEDEELRQELAGVIGEVRWRLRNLARQIVLPLDRLPPTEKAAFLSLADALMED
ncbi:HD-GYP domain-containing protein [Chromobacterium vaccinii]|uniref:HD-GYP domain-containing protein n=1 Tax=Chromobacterium vaccinii TaxID=1108595 RepID=UPI003C76CC7B